MIIDGDYQQNTNAHFVADGWERAVDGAKLELLKRRVEIAARIEASYAHRMAGAGIVRRTWLMIRISWEIKLEMKRQLKKLAPPDALYVKQP